MVPPPEDDNAPLRRAQAQLDLGRAAAALDILLDAIGGDRHHPLVERLGSFLLAPEHLATRQAIQQAVLAAGERAPQRVLHISQSLADLGLQQAAIELMALAYPRSDTFAAYYVAQWAMDAGDYGRAIEAADVAISDLMRRKTPVDRFLRSCLRGRTPLESLRFHPQEILSHPRFRKPLVLRWEALHRCRDDDRASLMAEFCQRLFPGHISVWTMAGNHALDRDRRVEAKAHFERALSLRKDDITALAGMAIVSEKEKNWHKALRFRKQVAEVAHAFAADDSASLHRVIRYGAALGRLSRFQEAGRHLRDCIRRGAFARLPHERPALLRMFCGPLYSPAMIQHILNPSPDGAPWRMLSLNLAPELIPPVALALRDGAALKNLSYIQTPTQDTADAHLLAGMLAWEMRDPELAHHHFDQADTLRPDDMATNYLLLSSALEVDAPDLDGITRFALALARQVRGDASAEPEAEYYAQLTLERLTPQRASSVPLRGVADAFWRFARTYAQHEGERATLLSTKAAPLPLRPGAPPLHVCVALRETWSVLEFDPGQVQRMCTQLHLSMAERNA